MSEILGTAFQPNFAKLRKPSLSDTGMKMSKDYEKAKACLLSHLSLFHSPWLGVLHLTGNIQIESRFTA
jgi:hypothetical protein